ncbi:MAG TPA: glycosyltransferase family 1 protein [Solirubrobacteraceae bacterium]
MIHVGLNLVWLTPGEHGGLEVYARELVARLAERPDLRLTAFVNRALGPWPGVPSELVPVTPARRVEWVRGEQELLPRAAARAGCDLVHSLASTAPLRGRYRRVTTIHDLNYMKVPESHFGVRGLGMRVLVPAAAWRSHRIVVDSASTRDDVVHHLRVRAGRIDVVPLGVGFTRAAAPRPAGELRAQLGLGDRQVVLSVSAKRPHKNLMRLLGALARIPAERRPALVVPGYPTPHEAQLRERAAELGLDGDLRMLDWVSAADLEGLYALAEAFVFPSLYEGFGLPVLEAMTRGVPVACSDRSSLPEVAGDAALLFDPDSEEQIAGAIERLLSDGGEAERLRAAGRARAARFTWERTAEQTAESYRRALAA